MAGNHLFIRLDLSNGRHIGPGKIALLEAMVTLKSEVR